MVFWMTTSIAQTTSPCLTTSSRERCPVRLLRLPPREVVVDGLCSQMPMLPIATSCADHFQNQVLPD